MESTATTLVSKTGLTRYSSASSSGVSGNSSFTSEDTESSAVVLFNTSSTTMDTLEDLSSEHEARVRRACHYKCYCKCHEEDATPPRRRLGKLKSKKLGCTDVTCLSYTTVEENYKLHSKSFFGALSQAMSSHNIKVRYNMNTYRMISEGCDAMRFVKHGHLEKLRACIQSGEATIWDTAQDGWSLLHVSIFTCARI